MAVQLLLLILAAFATFGSSSAYTYCYGDYSYTCSDDQYCCGIDQCCLSTDSYSLWALWYFWLLLFLGIAIVSSCIGCCVRAARRRQLQRIYGVNGVPRQYGTVIVSSNSNSSGYAPIPQPYQQTGVVYPPPYQPQQAPPPPPPTAAPGDKPPEYQ